MQIGEMQRVKHKFDITQDIISLIGPKMNGVLDVYLEGRHVYV